MAKTKGGSKFLALMNRMRKKNRKQNGRGKKRQRGGAKKGRGQSGKGRKRGGMIVGSYQL